MSTKDRRPMTKAMLFILLFGIVSLFSDMTHEGASSIRGAYLSLLGASAAAIGAAQAASIPLYLLSDHWKAKT